MNFTDLQYALQNLIKGKKISQTDIANALNLTRATISKRVKSNSEITVSELLHTQEHIGAKIYERVDRPDICVISNTKERIKDDSIIENYEFFPHRLSDIQDSLEYLNKDMAKLMDMSEERYSMILAGKEEITGKELAKLSSRIDICLDELVKGKK